jgi:Gluconate 2-dehydrogenase subunit 3
MNRRKAIKLILLGSASVTSLISHKWLDKLKSTDIAYLFDKQNLIAELAETIIPETDTPGAKAVGVHEFIIRMLTDCADPRSLNKFIIGIQELEEYSFLNYKRSFTFCTAGQKEAILQEFERRANPYKGILGKVENKILGRSFFTLLKAYTVMGFCTSQLGATRALNYEGIPGRYENVGPINPRQRSWATK